MLCYAAPASCLAKMPHVLMTFPKVFGGCFISKNLEELIVPSLWESEDFTNKLGKEKEGQMWLFQDKGGRNCCLIPEVTAIVQKMWRENWSKTRKNLKLFYITRCYRYDRPQMGRYREFTQVGVEFLGPTPKEEVMALLTDLVSSWGDGFVIKESVKRGLSYYVEDGFEVEAPWLGAQKQVVGGGRFKEGIGFALGLDRLDLALKTRPQ